MPWQTIEKDGRYCVYKLDGDNKPIGDTLGCHDNESDADNHVKALYANEKEMAMPSIDDMPEAKMRQVLNGMRDKSPQAKAMMGDKATADMTPDEMRAMLKRMLADEDMGPMMKTMMGEIAEYTNMSTDLFFTDLTSLADGRPFDGIAPVDTLDMRGQPVVIKEADLSKIVANTLAAIEATKTEAGDIVGLPIDARMHDKGDAAGWIVGVELVGQMIRLLPRWTELGIELIGKKIQQYFSATVDLTNKVILGGTLTNWPAMRDKKWKVLLRPIELSQNLYVETGANDPGVVQDKGVYEMEITEEKLNELIAAGVERSLGGVVEKALGGNGTKPTDVPASTVGEADLITMLGLGHLPDEAAKRIELQLASHFQAIQKSAELQYMQRLSQLNRRHEVAELAQRVTGGTEDAPRGLPVTAEALTDALIKLPSDQAQFWTDLVSNVVKNGLVEFAELGHGKQLQGVTPVAEWAKPLIADYIATGGTLAEFFTANPELGDMSQYNLAEFAKDK